ncbi:hypothetical protein PE36_15125 [Moritella sp. PE36]|nr:hypothetical protein PE36_15125 [Moritella sp. PE36]
MLINLGKQQFGELGPATQRLNPGEYTQLPETKRSTFFRKRHSASVVLERSKHDVDMFESKAIVKYLITTFAL